MKEIISKAKERLPLILLIALGVSAGLLNGLLGTGGGIVLLFGIKRIMKELEEKDAFALSLFSVCAISLFSLFSYIIADKAELSFAAKNFLPAAAGGLIGAILLERIDISLLKTVFAALLIYSGIKMIF